MKKNSRNFAVIATLIVVVVVVIGIAVWFTKTKVQESAQQQTATTQPAPKDEITRWVAYTNEKYGFEFRHPSSWILEEELGAPVGDKIAVKNPSHEDSYFWVLPIGYAAGSGVYSASKTTQEMFLEKSVETTSYLLEDGQEWSRWIHFKKAPQKNWSGEFGFIQMFAHVDNLKEECKVPITPSHPECGLGDPFGYFGEVDVQDWNILNQILSTFKFLPEN